LNVAVLQMVWEVEPLPSAKSVHPNKFTATELTVRQKNFRKSDIAKPFGQDR